MDICKEHLNKFKKYFLPFSFVFIGMGCFLIFWLVGSRINSEGMLVEPFFLLPLGYFFSSLGIFWGLANSFLFRTNCDKL